MVSAVIDWKTIKDVYSFTCFEKDTHYVLKTMDTKRLITKHSDCIFSNNKISVFIHELESSKEAIVGYEIVRKYNFPLVVENNYFVLFGTSDFDAHNSKILYNDTYLRIFKFDTYNFLLVCKSSVFRK
ncbi:MAG TPA: hypothetical protein VMZ91_14410 [Candidatus Paceibacterota bacterium]|nr:hypothetical protein [Candidatus Paceibacterota bacterium]